MSFESDYKEFVAKREFHDADGATMRELALTEPTFMVDSNTGHIRINTVRMVLARHSRAMRRGTVAKALGVSIRDVRMMENPRRALFLHSSNVSNISEVFEYPVRFFITFETNRIDGDNDATKQQLADWRRHKTPKWYLFAE